MGTLQIWIISMHSKDRQMGCPVCGYPDFQAFDDCGLTTYEICPSCGSQSGYDYSERSVETDFLKLRRSWVNDRGAKWYSSNSSPDGWDAHEQMRDAGLSIQAKS